MWFVNFVGMKSRVTYEKECIICGDTFDAKRKHARCCSAKCRAVKSQQKRSKGGKHYKRKSVFEKINEAIDRKDIDKGSKVFIPESLLKHWLKTDQVPAMFSTGKYTFKKNVTDDYPRYETIT